MILIPQHIETWLKNRLPNIITRTGMHRSEKPIIPFELLREPIINALVHRDYEIKGAKCQLILSPEFIQVMSPGGPLPPITLDQLQSLHRTNAKSQPSTTLCLFQNGISRRERAGNDNSAKYS